MGLLLHSGRPIPLPLHTESSLGSGGRGDGGRLPGSVGPGPKKQQCGPRLDSRQRPAGERGPRGPCSSGLRTGEAMRPG